MVNFGEFLQTLSLRLNSITRQVIFFRLSTSWGSIPIRTTLIGLGGRGFFIFLFPRVHEAWFLNCAKSALAASSKRNSYLRSTGNDAAAALLQKCTSSCQLLGSIQQHLHVQNSSKQLLSFHHFSSGPRTIRSPVPVLQQLQKQNHRLKKGPAFSSCLQLLLLQLHRKQLVLSHFKTSTMQLQCNCKRGISTPYQALSS